MECFTFFGSHELPVHGQRPQLRHVFSVKQNSDARDRYHHTITENIGSQCNWSFSSGRMGLYAILKAAKIGVGDEVILPAFTCVVVPNAVIYAGADPVYVDISVRDFNINVELIREAITPKTRAIYAQHTFGLPCNIASIRRICDEFGLLLIEDCALALGASVNGFSVGTFGDAAFFSTDHSKTINTITGGFVVSDNAAIKRQLDQIYTLTPELSLGRELAKICAYFIEDFCFDPKRYITLGPSARVINYLLGAFHRDELSLTKPEKFPVKFSRSMCLLGLLEFDRLDENLSKRQRVFDLYESTFQRYQWLDENVSPAWLRYSILIEDRDYFLKKSKDRFNLGIWFTTPVHGRERDFSAVSYHLGSCPVAEWVTTKIVNFPTNKHFLNGGAKSLIEEWGKWLKYNEISEI